MHRRTNSKSNHAVSTYSRKLHIAILPILGIATSLGLSALLPSPNVSALDIPSISIAIGNPLYDNGVNDLILTPNSNSNSYASYEVPVYIDLTGTEEFNVFIRSSNESEANAIKNSTWSDAYDYGVSSTTGNLIGKKDGNTSTIKSLANIAGYNDTTGITEDDFKDMTTSTWGYRWIFNKDNKATRPTVISDAEKASIRTKLHATSFYGIKAGGTPFQLYDHDSIDVGWPERSSASVSQISPNLTIDSDHRYSGRLVLQFAANVTPDLPADEYSGYVAVSVVATPYKATIFDIESMQQMTTDICENTPIPAVNASGSLANKWGYYNGPTQSDFELHNDKDFYVGTPNNTSGTISYADSTIADYTSLLETYKSNPSAGFSLVPETLLKDERDNKYYLVRKLADGNCWMSQNLNYTLKENDESQLIDVSLTDFTGTWQNATIHSTISVFGESWANAFSDGLRSFSTSEYAGTQGAGSSAFVHQAGDSFTSASSGTPSQYRGILYNWHAATAGSFDDNLSNEGAAPSSICPKGWQLPDATVANNENYTTYTSTRSFYHLFNSYATTNAIAFPLNFFPSGYYSSARWWYPDISGLWWTNTSSSENFARVLSASKNGAKLNLNELDPNTNEQIETTKPATSEYRRGLSIRCVAK